MSLSFMNFFNNIASPDRLVTAVLAMMIVVAVGMMTGARGGNANPLLWALLDKALGGLTRKTYKTGRSESSLQFRGALILTLYLLMTGGIAALVVLIERRLPLASFTEPLLVALCLSGGATWAGLIRLHHALRAEENSKESKLPKGSFFDIAVSTRTNLNTTDNHGIIRTGIGFMAVNFDKAVVVPLFWYVIAGLPALFFYTGIAAARWGLSKEGFAKGIGTLATMVDKIVSIVPHVLSALILSCAALLTPQAGFVRALYGMFTDKGMAPYAEGGVVVTTTAYALDISLGGPIEDCDGSVLKRSWVGSSSSTARATRHHLRVAIYLSVMAHIILAALLLALAFDPLFVLDGWMNRLYP